MIHYKRGYKYQLEADYHHRVDIFVDQPIDSLHWVQLLQDGELFIRAGYAWDGPSGPTIDTPSFMRGSLVHDGLYQLIREGGLSPAYRSLADTLLRDICLEDGMSRLRASAVYWSVCRYGERHCRPGTGKPVLTAP